MKNASLLAWMDMEMTGLDPQRDEILEIACILTDGDLNIVAEGPTLTLKTSEKILASMDEWNKTHHEASGLLKRVRTQGISTQQAELLLLDFLRNHLKPQESPLCGNSIWQDRRFLAHKMPRLEAFFHYRIIDVSSIKELAKRWYPNLPPFEKKKKHEALSDIRESIAELRYYRQKIFLPMDSVTASAGKTPRRR